MSYKKYHIYKEQISYDGGITWENTGNEAPSGNSIATFFTSGMCECGSTDKKMSVILNDGEKYDVYCCNNNGEYTHNVSQSDIWEYVSGGTAPCDNPQLFERKFIRRYIGPGVGDCNAFAQPNGICLIPTDYGEKIKSITFNSNSCISGIGSSYFCNYECTQPEDFCTCGNRLVGDIGIIFQPNVENINFGNGIISIGNGVFAGNPKLTGLTTPIQLKSIGLTEPNQSCDSHDYNFGAFSNCGLVNVTLSGIEHIGTRSFYSNLSLKKITIGSGCTRLDENVFDNCPRLEQIVFCGTTVPECHKISGGSDYTWSLASSLPEYCKIYVPCEALSTFKNSNLSRGYANIIYGYGGSCGDLPSVILISKIESITIGGDISSGGTTYYNLLDYDGNTVFSSADTNALTSYGISLKWVKNIVFNGVTTFGEKLFYDNSSIKEINIPNRIKTIKKNAFWGSGLVTATIGTGITKIEDYAFGYCSYFTSITINATTPPTLGNDVFWQDPNLKIYVPAASIVTYKTASGWSTYASQIYAI